jgi:NAD(P)-dependent dehydrogenase (short-subunit alcohol dehydrogenase family)
MHNLAQHNKKGTELFSLQGKRVLITGATGYLGTAMVQAMAEAGAHVLVNSRSEQKADALVQTLLQAGLSAESAAFDIRDEEAINAFVLEQEEQAIHVLINNAYAGGAGSIESATAGNYAESYDVTLLASHHLLQALLPNLRQAATEDGGASVINIASMYGMVSPDLRVYASKTGANPPFYGAAKAALLQWTRYAACEFGVENIRVNAISPGPFPSEQVQENNPDFIRLLENKVPMGRIGQAHELQGAIVFLASSASSYVNGTNLVVDGGWTSW